MKNVFKFLGIAFVACSMFVACGDDVETFTIKVKANDSSMGTVTGGGKYESGATATLEATANAGYVFVDWEDGTKNNPRLVTVTGDAEYTANFAVQSGVKIAFGNAEYNAEYINAQTNSQLYQIAAAQGTTADYPFAVLRSSSLAVGTTSASPSIDMSAGTANAGDPYLWYFTEDSGITLGGNAAGDWWCDNLSVNVSAFDATAMTISLVANGTAKHITGLFDGESWAELESKPMTMTATAVTLTSVKAAFPTMSGKLARK